MSNQTISTGKTVYLTYSIRDEAMQVLEQNDLPVSYVHGIRSRLHRRIEEALEGKGVGDEVSVTLEGDEGFGPHDPHLTFRDDLDNVPEQFHEIGAQVEMQNERGETKTFTVTEIDNGQLTLDGNHPFAGQTVHFTVNVTEVRDATPEELQSGEDAAPGVH